MTDPKQHANPSARPPVRDSGPVEGVRGNREVPPADLDALKKERDEYLDALQRLKAEFDNYRRRTERDREAVVTGAQREVVRGLLPVMDNLERADCLRRQTDPRDRRQTLVTLTALGLRRLATARQRFTDVDLDRIRRAITAT